MKMIMMIIMNNPDENPKILKDNISMVFRAINFFFKLAVWREGSFTYQFWSENICLLQKYREVDLCGRDCSFLCRESYWKLRRYLEVIVL